MRVFILALAILAVPLGTSAQELETQLKVCAAVQDRDARLECYDELSGRQMPAEDEEGRARPELSGGDWKVTRETSPIDDSETTYVSLIASRTTPATPGLSVPTLFIRCKENRLESFINWGVPVGAQAIDVTTRLDDEAAQTKKWTVSSDFSATFVRGSHSAFVAQLRVHDRLVARLVPLGHNETTAIFDLSGLNDVIGEVFASCKR